MKKFLSSLLCLLLALSMVLCFAACASEKKDDEKEEEKTSAEEKEEETPEDDDETDAVVDPKVGTYELYAMGTEDEMTTAEDIMKEANVTTLEGFFGLEMKADGTGVVTLMGESDNITWNATQLIDSDGASVEYEFENDMLAFEIEGVIFAFIKK